MEGSTTLQDRPRISSPEEFWTAYAGIPTAAAVGLIRDLPDIVGLGKPLSVGQAVGILTRIGHETDSEPNQNLRDAARLVLARHFARRLAEQMEHDHSADSRITDHASVDALLGFYSQHAQHSAVPDRDRDHISRFLAACCRYHRTPCLQPALFTTFNYQLLPISALPDLYALLVRRCTRNFPPLWWDGWSQWPNEIGGFSSDQDRLATDLRIRLRKIERRVQKDLFLIWQACNMCRPHQHDPSTESTKIPGAIDATRNLLIRFDTMCQAWRIY